MAVTSRAPGASTESRPAPLLRGTTAVLVTIAVVIAEFVVLDAVHRHVHHMLLADLLYVCFLAIACLGWSIWFGKLVARHRALERTLTEEQARAIGAQRLAALVRGSADAILVSDSDGIVDYASPAVRAVLGISPGLAIGKRLTDIVAAGDRDAFIALLGVLENGDETPLQTKMTCYGGRIINVEGSVGNFLDDPAVKGIVVTFRDVTERVRLESALTRQAFHDSLTGLANRQLFSDRLEHAMQPRTPDERRSIVVLYCDLDEFKLVNDSRGHTFGDRVLVEAARRANHVVRLGDTVARLGGDEFAVLLDDADLETAIDIGERICTSLAESMNFEGDVVTLSVSVGVAITQVGSMPAEALLRNADVAMYLAKGRGKHTVAVYDADLHAAALRKIDVRLALDDALAAGEIGPYYQPIVEVGTGAVVGFEALARWTQADGSVVPPNEFIPVAEQSGAIHELGRIMLRAACRDAAAFSCHAGRPLTMSVNVTVSQLCRDDFVTEVVAILEATALAPHQLTIEITESELALQPDIVDERLASLRVHGIRIAIDDFGTGFNSLSCLRTLEIDALKIDKSFIDDVMDGDRGAAIALSIFDLAASMSLATVAEGVEDDDQARWLAGTACTNAQGYLWSRAVSREAAFALLPAAAPAITPAVA